MTIKTTIIALTTAIAIAGGALAPTGASASPFTNLASTSITTDAAGVETVGGRGGHRHRFHHGHRGHRGHHGHRHGGYYGHGAGAAGAAAIIGLGAFAIGAALANQQRCYTERTRVWSRRYGAYVVRQERVCR
ncbi:hypothetical protein [Acuticoccus mangrovi]|uniref:BA14K family protein n=1 Tax=Acuticoccus mangrovi TaxID=2796142 RepID=A0A934MFZ1_9HYPH|nr:hypothetical protein [Acuticoccus mangrovi]MBJ3775993.1 hypothetical protein [Acuticoccus mangrovi]